MSENGDNGQDPGGREKHEGNTPGRHQDGRWKAGCSGNVRGRPRAPTVTECLRSMLAETGESGRPRREDLAAQILDMAAAGHMQAITLICDRVDGKARNATDDVVNIGELPALVDAASCKAAAAIVVGALGSGEIGIDAGQRLMSIIDGARRCVEMGELEERLTALEERRSSFAATGRRW